MSTPKEVLSQKKLKAKEELSAAGFFKPLKIYVGSATCENAAGAKEIMKIFETQAGKKDCRDFYLSKKGCVGRCNLEPTVEVYEEGKKTVLYVKVNEKEAEKIIDKHIKVGK
ncbi:MAG: (2Fe-2S) ferredoxin domain-containing protein [Endomicrobium sp.]|jgi:(2Fe-2S) ferredoxin|nr:(2Fe-2S) ferredoxin domain-containing protein [Endomicrobium sp.]